MEIKYLVLYLVAFLNLLLGLFIIKKNRRSKINLYFGSLCIVGCIWTLSMSLLYTLNNLAVLDWIIRLMVVTSTLMFLLYFLFALQYPYPTPVRKPWLIPVLPVILIVLGLLGFLPVEKLYFFNGRLVEQTIFGNYLIFAIYYIVYLFLTFYVLFKKFFASEGIQRLQLKYILISSGVTFAIMTFFSVILPLINGYFTDWFSPIFTLINFFVISHLIFIKNR